MDLAKPRFVGHCSWLAVGFLGYSQAVVLFQPARPVQQALWNTQYLHVRTLEAGPYLRKGSSRDPHNGKNRVRLVFDEDDWIQVFPLVFD